MKMPSTAIVCGILLILIGLIGYGYGILDGKASMTALIPAFFGIVLVALGAAARAKDNLRKHLMHTALVVALIGFIIPAARVLSKISEFSFSPAILSQIWMALICLLFLILGVKSFIDARRGGAV